MTDPTARERFLSKFDKGRDDECWIWKAAIGDGTGYGIMRYNGVSTGSHRISWMVFRGEIPDGMWVLHNCPGGDNRKCVNPNHLWLGTQDENNKDAAAKGRTQKGEKHWNAKLTDQNIEEIFSLKHQGVSQTAIATMFGVCQSHVCDIVNGYRRQHTA